MYCKSLLPSIGPGQVALYGLPRLGVGFMFGLLNVYFLKFSTDVLLVAPASMGILFAVGRLWDAISDPVVGSWSDATRSRWGRRRPWIAASMPPLGIAFLALWSPLPWLQGGPQLAWLGLSVLVFYTGYTGFCVPHMALGAELSELAHDRTRLFGARVLLDNAGLFLAFGGIYLLEQSANPGRTAAALATGAALLACVGGTVPLLWLREPREHAEAGGTGVVAAARGVWASRHARRIVMVYFLEQWGLGLVVVTLPYASDYVLLTPGSSSLYFAAFLVPFTLAVPLWTRLSRTWDRQHLWLAALALKGAAFAGLWLASGFGRAPELLFTLIAVAGACHAAGETLGPSLNGDIARHDARRTGERKEGAFFAAWTFAGKSAASLAIAAAGLMLEAFGFQPNVAQSETAQGAIRALVAGVPALAVGAGALLILNLGLAGDQQTDVRHPLDRPPPEADGA